MSPTLQTLVPVAAGIAVVIVAILVFRLHAFFALLLAAATTAALTPREALFRYELEQRSADVLRLTYEEWAGQHGWLFPDAEDGGYEVFRTNSDNARMEEVSTMVPHRFKMGGGFELFPEAPEDFRNGNLFTDGEHVLDASNDYRPVPGDIVIRPHAREEAFAASNHTVPTRIASAFGDTVGSIGLLIAFASVIGICLLDSGAADRIVRSALTLVGERGAPVAFTGCGFMLGVPVFFDTVFLLMIPLAKALRLRTGRNYILYVLTVVCGATMAHSLVPPTPGPLLVAEALNVDIGMMILVGTAVGLITAAYGILHALVVNRLMTVPLRDTPEMPLKDLEQLAARPDHELPPLWFSLLPIVVPVWLIAQQTALKILEKNGMQIFGDVVAMAGWQKTLINTLGDKNVAVGIGVAIGLLLLVWQTRQSLAQVRNRVGAALAAGGAIILITAAGGAFGEMLEQTGVASILKQMPTLGPSMLLTVAFLVTVAIRTAQGSATVAMITAVGLFAGIETPFHPVWLALAIGCGSKPISWMTDSGFWVICKMSGMTEAETLKTLTPMTSMMGVVGLVTVILGAMVLPMQ